jgi:hypothetical protein
MKKRGRPRKEKTQTAEERRAYMREYNKRPHVKEMRRKAMAKYRARIKAEETSEERDARLAEDREYRRMMRQAETPEETEARKAKERLYRQRSLMKKRQENVDAP